MAPTYHLVWLIMAMIILPKLATSTPNFLYSYCSNTSVFNPNDKFKDNLDTLFSNLVKNATNNPTGFHHTEVGVGTDNVVYGLFLCRGDQNTSACSECVETAVGENPIKNNCGNRSKDVIMWYDECMLRYSKDQMIGRIDLYPAFLLINTQNISWEYNETIANVFQTLAKSVTSGMMINNYKKYYGIIALSSSQPLYALAQCTQDLTPNDCYECLQTSVDYLWIRMGARTLLPSCNVRYETYPFFDLDHLATTRPSDDTSNPIVIDPPPPSSPPSPPPPGEKNKMTKYIVVATCSAIFGAIVVGMLIYKCYAPNNDYSTTFDIAGGTIESLQFSLGMLQTATNNFCEDNKIGQGGFGRVYKGILPNGENIAVKKLVRRSGTGEEEFKNEMKVVAKLQHRNLVRLLGFCLGDDERLLVFEYVPNRSLDHFIFDIEKQRQLNWSKRFKIIVGIARGLLYLHEDSRLKIIHRDLKPANILLDMEMNPKIADFGMARIFGANLKSSSSDAATSFQQITCGDQTHQSTKQAGGTLGYMAPEYIQTLQFSEKTDVYSFGVIVLEIISGKKNRTFYQLGSARDLLTYAWIQWRENKPLEMMDVTLEESYLEEEVIKCINIGLSCVQHDPNARPTMANILHVLNNVSSTTNTNTNSVALQVLQQPASFINDTGSDGCIRPYSSESIHLNKSLISYQQDSVTELYPR